MGAAKQVGPAIFFSLLVILVSFLPVFLLEAQEGRMFRPLACTKTLSVAFSSILAITLVPVLMVIFIRGHLRPESENPFSRWTQALYLPVLRFCLGYRKTTLLLNLIFLVVTLPLAWRIGSQFMPPLYEGSSLYMPTALPGISITQASTLLQEQDRIIKSFPEVESVFGAVGRSDSPTDNAPLDMYDTTIMLKPREQWRAGMTYEKLIREMDEKLQFPGLTNTWTMPVQNRLDMELTGIKTPVGLKIQGPNVEGIQRAGAQLQQVLGGIPELRSIFAERVAEGFYINVEVNRPEAARYGLTVADVQRAVTSGIGGENVAENIEGRERYPINVRYSRDFRDDIAQLQRVVIATPTGAQIPISEVAKVYFSRRLADRLCLSRPRNEGLRWFCCYGEPAPQRKITPSRGIQLQVVLRVRIRSPRQGKTEVHRTHRVFCDLLAALYGLPLGYGSRRPHFPHVLCDDRRTHSPVLA